MALGPETWEGTLTAAWRSLRDRVEDTHDLTFSHEHTVQFHFAWEVARLLKFSDAFQVRFETHCGKDGHGKPIWLDLLFWTDPAFKVAVEMKAPCKSKKGSNSAMTHGRMSFYQDLDRLWHLVKTRKESIARAMFLAVVNEPGYVVRGRQHVNLCYETYHGVQVAGGLRIPPTPGRNGCKHEMVMAPRPFTWQWSCETQDGEVRRLPNMSYFWLEPLAITPTETAR